MGWVGVTHICSLNIIKSNQKKKKKKKKKKNIFFEQLNSNPTKVIIAYV
jgi:hypothetical protein